MDIFRILSRGASLKKTKEITTDYALPSDAQTSTQRKKEESMQNQIDKETDFFHTKSHIQPPKADAAAAAAAAATNEKVVVVPPPTIASEADAAVLRKANKAKVTGLDVPLPIGSFQDLTSRYRLDKKLLSNLIEADFVEPTAIQSEAIPIALDGRDLIACAPTGSGKTLAFLIPLVQALLDSPKADKHHGIRGLIISPTNELATQIFQNLEILTRSLGAGAAGTSAKGSKKGKRAAGLSVAILSKQLANKLNNNIINAAKYDIIVSTPLRLIDVIKNEKISLAKVEQLVIDEADKLFDHGFVEQTDDILAHCTGARVRKSMFSATIPSSVEEMAQTIMRDPVRVIVGHKEAANNTIEQKLVFTGNEDGKLLAIRQMIADQEFKPPIIIFLQSITRAKALFHELLYDKLNVEVIHAERTPKQRDEAIRRFKRGDVWVLITTDVLARGVDFKGVNLVINYDVPQSAQAYVHRIGRTGRGGKAGRAVTFFTKDDSMAVKPILNVIKQSDNSNSHYSAWMEDLDKLSKNDKKKIKQHAIKRKHISTVPKIVKHKRRQREEMIESSKRRKEMGTSTERSE